MSNNNHSNSAGPTAAEAVTAAVTAAPTATPAPAPAPAPRQWTRFDSRGSSTLKVLSDNGGDVVVIQFGSEFLRLGFANQRVPSEERQCLAYRSFAKKKETTVATTTPSRQAPVYKEKGDRDDTLHQHKRARLPSSSEVLAPMAEESKQQQRTTAAVFSLNSGHGLPEQAIDKVYKGMGIGHEMEGENSEKSPSWRLIARLPTKSQGRADDHAKDTSRGNGAETEQRPCQRLVFYGNEALSAIEASYATSIDQLMDQPDQACEAPHWDIIWPIRMGRLHRCPADSFQRALDALEGIWDFALQKHLNLRKSDRCKYSCLILIPEAMACSISEIKAVLGVCLVALGFKYGVCHLESLGACVSQGTTTACVVSLGSQVTSICCIDDGVVLNSSRVLMPIAPGCFIRDVLTLLIMRSMHFPKEFTNFFSSSSVSGLVSSSLPKTESEQASIRFESSFEDILKARLMEQVGHSFCSVLENEMDPEVEKQKTVEVFERRYAVCFYSEPNVVSRALFDAALHAETSAVQSLKTASESEGIENILGNKNPMTPGSTTKTPLAQSRRVSEVELTELDDEGAQATTGSSMVAARKIEDAVVHSIMSCGDNVDLRQKLFSMIILTGGCARIRGMSEVIEGRVFESLPEDSNVETVEVIDLKNESSRNTIVRYRETSQHPELFEKATMESPVDSDSNDDNDSGSEGSGDPAAAAWRGGAILAALDSSRYETWIRHDELEEGVRRRFRGSDVGGRPYSASINQLNQELCVYVQIFWYFTPPAPNRAE